MQVRPCFLVVDNEHAGSVSARKLVLETAKYNVVTAYSAHEAALTLDRFPNLDGVVVSSILRGEGMPALAKRLAEMPDLKLVIVGDHLASSLAHLPHLSVESFAPAKLLELLRTVFPAEAQQMLQREYDLEAEEN